MKGKKYRTAGSPQWRMIGPPLCQQVDLHVATPDTESQGYRIRVKTHLLAQLKSASGDVGESQRCGGNRGPPSVQARAELAPTQTTSELTGFSASFTPFRSNPGLNMSIREYS
jgi:hypothetical protein